MGPASTWRTAPEVRAVTIGLALLALAAGCGEGESAPDGGGAGDLAETGGPDGDVAEVADGAPADGEADAGDGGTGSDGEVADGSGETLADGSVEVDAAPGEVSGDADGGSEVPPPPDLIPDTTPPEVSSTSPSAQAEGVAVPFTVEVTFSEPVAPNTIAPETVKLLDAAGDGEELSVERSLENDQRTVVVTPQAEDLERLSPYTVWLAGGIITDQAGNDLPQNVRFTFYTAGYDDTEVYRDVAARYAPRIHSETTDVNPAAQVPVRVNADGDWTVADNVEWLKQEADSLVPIVYYDVTETYSHYFVNYLYFFPWVNHPTQGYDHGNGALGALVTVEKGHGDTPERPVAVTTYFKLQAPTEENRTFVTADSGIVGSEDPGYYGVEAVYPREELFPGSGDGSPGGHYEAYISAGEHDSCLWIRDDAQDAFCELNPGRKNAMTKLVLAHGDGVPTTIDGSGGWPATTEEVEGASEVVHYGLEPLAESLWPRRAKVGPEAVWADTYTYEAGADRPGDGVEMPSKFYDPIQPVGPSFGRPPWAWSFEPASGSDFDKVDRGWISVDPAWYVWRRHSDVDGGAGGLESWDAEAEAGFSTSYCFNALLGLDARGEDPQCPSPDDG